MSVKEQVFWLRDHPTDPALPPGTNLRLPDFLVRCVQLMLGSGFVRSSSLVTAALPHGICTRFPILL
jgi:hypothetical protein